MQIGNTSTGGPGAGSLSQGGVKVNVNGRIVTVIKQLGEGGFSFVYLVKEETEKERLIASPLRARANACSKDGAEASLQPDADLMVLKISSIQSREQRDIAEKEVTLLQKLNHPSIVKLIDHCIRIPTPSGGIVSGISRGVTSTNRPQHMILMEYCDGGHLLGVMQQMEAEGRRFDLPSLIVQFGQICNAVSFMHAQRPSIVHRDLKPSNFLMQNSTLKLCDFGSAVIGHVPLDSPRARAEEEEVIEKTTTQMFRAPEMVDLYMTDKLTESTDVWALGCCLYSMAFFQNCFDEGSNLAILSRNYKIPENNPYGYGLVELIDRMLTVDSKYRADMTEVIKCLSSLYSGRPLPPRKSPTSKAQAKKLPELRVGAYRTDGQGVRSSTISPSKKTEGKKLNPNSAAARRRGRRHTETPPLIKPDSLRGSSNPGKLSYPSSDSSLSPKKSKPPSPIFSQQEILSPLSTHLIVERNHGCESFETSFLNNDSKENSFETSLNPFQEPLLSFNSSTHKSISEFEGFFDPGLPAPSTDPFAGSDPLSFSSFDELGATLPTIRQKDETPNHNNSIQKNTFDFPGFDDIHVSRGDDHIMPESCSNINGIQPPKPLETPLSPGEGENQDNSDLTHPWSYSISHDGSSFASSVCSGLIPEANSDSSSSHKNDETFRKRLRNETFPTAVSPSEDLSPTSDVPDANNHIL